MGTTSICCGLVVAALWSSPVRAAENSNRIEGRGTTAQGWALIGDFCGIATWHPAIATCTIADKDGAKIRTLTTKDGATFVEKLVKWDAPAKSYTYAILKSPLPVTDYLSTIKVEEDDEPGKVAITWSSTFTPRGVSEDAAKQAVANVYLAGLLKLKSELKGK